VTPPPIEPPAHHAFRHVTLTYVLALAVIAGLSIGSHLLADKIVAKQEETARIVNLSGRQRMLSQRIAELSLELGQTAAGDERSEIESRLSQAIKQMDKSHAALTLGSAELGIEPTGSRAVAAIYDEEPHHLNRRVTDYLSLASAFLALPPDQRGESTALKAILDTAHETILVSLDEVVKQYQLDSEAAIKRLRVTLFAMMTVMLFTLAIEAAFIFRPLFRRLRRTQAELIEVASTDPLTGCMNRRHLVDSAERELDRARRYGFPTCVLMLDIDHFKQINDRYGHAVGDEAIRSLVRSLLESLRSTDILGRMGGEEFAIILPQTGLEEGKVAAEKLRLAVAQEPVRFGNHAFGMTVSIGLTEMSPEDDGFFDVLSRADQAMYLAKQRGRNQVVAAANSGT
jgi:diguanylate cyclase (GGDEF)-like protein